MSEIDGSYGEGGGQIIRTSLALSLVTGKAFRAFNVRARRDKPGLRPQHLTAVNAAARIGGASVEGAIVGAREFIFHPGAVTPGEYSFDVGTAGSTTLVLQTVLPPLMIAREPSVLTFVGGTHNAFAPPFDFLATAFLPLVNRTGPRVEAQLERYGFYPRGGGRFSVLIEPATGAPARLELLERGAVRSITARALAVKLPAAIAERELSVVRKLMKLDEEQLRVEISEDSHSPGNVVLIEIESEHVKELFTRLGERGVRAEQVAESAAHEALQYLDSGAPVGEHLADQLLIPLALGAGGTYRTGPPSLHTTTNVEVISKFLDADISLRQISTQVWEVTVTP